MEAVVLYISAPNWGDLYILHQMEAFASRYWTGTSMQWTLMRRNIIKKKWMGHFQVLLCLCIKMSLSAKPFMNLKVSSTYRFLFMQIKSHFHENGFALRLVLIQRHKGTRKWPILFAVGKTTHISLSNRLVPVHCREYQYNLSLLHHSISVWNLYMYIFVLQLIVWITGRFFYQQWRDFKNLPYRF